MSYESLIAALLEEAETKRQAILDQAQAEADRLLAEAKRTAEDLTRQAEVWLEREIAKERTAILGRAVLTARHIVLQAKHEVLDLILQKAQWKALALSGEKRAAILGVLLQELLEAAPPAHLKVIANNRERATLLPHWEGGGIPIEFHPREDLILGVEVEADGAILRNCLSSRITKAKPKLIMELNGLLFAETPASS
jgi:vacuolar-type H+-ATPase subunit E/Vma4